MINPALNNFMRKGAGSQAVQADVKKSPIRPREEVFADHNAMIKQLEDIKKMNS